MTEAFDPYRRWLGIPPGERPPNHYALLGLSLFEEDADAISNAADRQMAYVRTHQTGPHAAVTQQLLNELAAARLCLLSAAQKTRYDAELKAKLAPAPRPAPAVPVPTLVAAPAPLPVARVQPWIAPDGAARGSSLRATRRGLPGWAADAAGGLAAGLLLAWVAMSLDGGGREIPVKPKAAPASPDAGKAVKQPGGAPPAVSIFKSIERPSPLGVVADKLVIWNAHNGPHNDRGALECNVRLLAGDREVWRKDGLALPWAPNEDQSFTMKLPSERFDRARIEITKWRQNGGGLAEIQVVSADGRNLALGQPAASSGVFGERFNAEHVVDGITTSAEAESGYWLSPERAAGWVEIDLSLPRPAKLAGVTADKLVIWNQHNGPINNCGTQWCDATLYSGERVAWRQEHVELPWAPGEDFAAELELPPAAFDRLRIDVAPRESQHAGLAEVQVLRADKNVALDCPALASAIYDRGRCESRVTDGFVSSAVESVGYWILPFPQMSGRVEIDLACLDAEYGADCRRLGLSLALADGDWQRGLPWLARGDDRALRRLARTDRQEMYDTPEQLAVADAWWELAGQADGEARKRLLARSLWRYRRVLSKLREFRKQQVQARLDEALSGLPERDYLFFMPELELKSGNSEFREQPVIVQGRPSPYGLFLHAVSNDSSHAAFHLGKRYRRFRGAAAINDSAGNRTATGLTFRVAGDGRALWKSSPLKETGASEDFDLDVAGVKKLELFVDCPGDYGWGHGVWIEPRCEP